jgi:hypothetical protein
LPENLQELTDANLQDVTFRKKFGSVIEIAEKTIHAARTPSRAGRTPIDVR